MGKCGGRELNYVSDVDVVFVAEPRRGDGRARPGAAGARPTPGLAAMMRACSTTTAEGTIWPVDAALRPEGKAGPLVRTLASHVAYYQRWAKTWEFQALLKARPVAGDLQLGRAYVDAVAPMVWAAAERDGLRRRRAADAPAGRGARCRPAKPTASSSSGPGGLRDVEFAVQLLQLVHGRTDEALRSPNTLEALEPLSTCGYVGRDDAAELDRGVPVPAHASSTGSSCTGCGAPTSCPRTRDELRRLGRSLGLRTDPVGELDREWRRHAREVRRLHEKLFYRPLLASVARLASRRGAAHAGGGPVAAGGARLRRPGRCAAPPRGADRAGSAGARRSSGRCCR